MRDVKKETMENTKNIFIISVLFYEYSVLEQTDTIYIYVYVKVY
jgi:hypothetical protein